MNRLLTSLLTGLLLSVVFFGISFAADGTIVHLHWLRDVFISPPLWLLQTGMPTISPSLTIEPGSPYSSTAFFALFFIAFWWLLSSIVVFTLRRKQVAAG